MSHKRLSILILFTLIIAATTIAMMTSTYAAPDSRYERLWGSDRYGTAVEISKKGWTASEYVIIARGSGYTDALCAGPLARKYNAPILLTA